MAKAECFPLYRPPLLCSSRSLLLFAASLLHLGHDSLCTVFRLEHEYVVAKFVFAQCYLNEPSYSASGLKTATALPEI